MRFIIFYDRGVDQVSVSVHHHYHHNSYCCSEASGLDEDGSEVKRVSAGEDGAPAPFIAVQPFPALLDLSPGSEAVKVSCGSRHTAVLTSEWGQIGWFRMAQEAPSAQSSWRLQERVWSLKRLAASLPGVFHRGYPACQAPKALGGG